MRTRVGDFTDPCSHNRISVNILSVTANYQQEGSKADFRYFCIFVCINIYMNLF